MFIITHLRLILSFYYIIPISHEMNFCGLNHTMTSSTSAVPMAQTLYVHPVIFISTLSTRSGGERSESYNRPKLVYVCVQCSSSFAMRKMLLARVQCSSKYFLTPDNLRHTCKIDSNPNNRPTWYSLHQNIDCIIHPFDVDLEFKIKEQEVRIWHCCYCVVSAKVLNKSPDAWKSSKMNANVICSIMRMYGKFWHNSMDPIKLMTVTVSAIVNAIIYLDKMGVADAILENEMHTSYVLVVVVHYWRHCFHLIFRKIRLQSISLRTGWGAAHNDEWCASCEARTLYQ